jgi:inhibitor of cysteine peptidase
MPPLTLRQADNGQSFSVAIAQPIAICLPENPTTGYLWAFDRLDESLIVLEECDFAIATQGGVGAGGERRFTLKGQQIGTVQVDLKLWRSWEGDASTIDRYHVTLQLHP